MRTTNNPFYIGNNRAMISLGPLTEKKYCPYNCAFCYVKSGFMKYAKMEISEIIKFLEDNRGKYNIIYISGDTDSFAPPRTDKAIELLKTICENFDIDVLFTTRTTFNNKNLKQLKSISDHQKKKNHKLIACISISRLFSANYIEPYPIPSPRKRIQTLEKLKENGLYTILTVRPFLPNIKANEYIEIIKEAKSYSDVVLGEVWYADEKLIEKVCRDINVDQVKFVEKTMDFDDNKKIWKCYEAKETVDSVTEYCRKNKIPFFMRSEPAVEYIKNK